MPHANWTEDDLRAAQARMGQVGDGRMATKAVSLHTGSTPLRTRAPLHGAPLPHYRSKWESAYASKLDLEVRAGLIRAFWYEPMSLWLPGKIRFKPDFLVQYPSGLERSLEIIEVKGWSKNRRDGITRLKIAAALFPCFTWRMVYKAKWGWEEVRL